MIGRKRGGGAPGWIVTFADMMSLLLALFVLMLSFSVTDAQRYRQIAGSMREAFGLQQFRRLAGILEIDGNPVREHARDARPQPAVSLALPDFPPMQDAEAPDDAVPDEAAAAPPREPMLSRMRARLAAEMADTGLTVGERDERIVISFPDTAAFPSGSATLSGDFLPVLDKLAALLAETEGGILVAGHTDSTPIATDRFRSNWDLAAARAVSVVHYWLGASALAPARLTAQGHADSRPVAANDSVAGRAANRRVEISIAVQ